MNSLSWKTLKLPHFGGLVSIPWDVLHSDSSQINTISVNKHGRLENHPLSIFIQGIAFTFIFQPGILLEYRIFWILDDFT